jgi:glycosyltransferase involved in cell wall biosynthesis
MSTTARPRISVFIPNYNHAAYLPAALASVCEQDPAPEEVVVFDDGSTDDSCAIVESFGSRYPFVHLVRYPEKSPDWVEACAQRLPKLRGDYLLGVGADDVLLPGCLRALSETIAKYPQAGVVFADYLLLNDRQQPVGKQRSGVSATAYLSGPAQEWQLCKPALFESGVAAAVRKDAQAWLLRNASYRMGPYCDVIGYSAVAMRYGAAYIPDCLAGLRIGHRADTYAQTAVRDEARFWALVERVREFLSAADVQPHVPRLVAAALENKVLATLPPGGPAAFQVLKWLLPLQNSDSAIVRGLYRGLIWPLRLADRLVRPGLLWYRRRRRPACSTGDAK